MAVSFALQELSVTFHNVDHWEAVVEELRLRPDLQLVPTLRSLAMHTSFTLDIPIRMDRFADMIQSRWESKDLPLGSSVIRPTLGHVQVVFGHNIFIPDSVLARLRRLVAEGLDMAVLDGLNQDHDQLL